MIYKKGEVATGLGPVATKTKTLLSVNSLDSVVN